MSKDRPSRGVRQRVAIASGNRCGYCLALKWFAVKMETEHIVPKAKGGKPKDESNLWLACWHCNEKKGTQTHARDPQTGRHVRLFNPRKQKWKEHFAFSADGTHIIGLTACGRATTAALKMNSPLMVGARAIWKAAGKWPPTE